MTFTRPFNSQKFAFGLMLAAFGLSSAALANYPPVSVKGRVMVESSLGQTELYDGGNITNGEMVMTAARSAFDVYVQDGRITLGPHSQLRVHSNEMSGDTEIVRLILDRGAVRITSGGGSDIRINLSQMRMRILGADVWIAADQGGETACVLRGAIEVQMPDKSAYRIQQNGECLLAKKGEPVRNILPSAEVLSAKLAITDFNQYAYAEPSLGMVQNPSPSPPPQPVYVPKAASAPKPIPAEPVAILPERRVNTPEIIAGSGGQSTPLSQVGSSVATGTSAGAESLVGAVSINSAIEAEMLEQKATITSNTALNSGWTVVIASLANGASASSEVARLRREGFDAHTFVSQTEKGVLHRIGVGKFATDAEARVFKDSIRSVLGFGWISTF